MKKSRAGSLVNEDLAFELKNPYFASEYIISALDENDPDFLKEALLDVIKAQGVTKVAESSEVNRQAIYKMLSPEGNPTLINLTSLLEAVGLELTVQPKNDNKKVS